MSDLNVTVVSRAERAERTVAAGTRAWELFADGPSVIAARVDHQIRDLSSELTDGAEVERRRSCYELGLPEFCMVDADGRVNPLSWDW